MSQTLLPEIGVLANGNGNGNGAKGAANSQGALKMPELDGSEIWRRGHCKWFNVAKGWGFITPADGGQDVFVHQSVLHMQGFRSLGDEEIIEFFAEPSSKGLEATAVRGVQGATIQGSHRRPGAKVKTKTVRCFNCGDFGNHLATRCPQAPMPKRCHHCKSTDHLIEGCPTLPEEQKRSGGQNTEDGAEVLSSEQPAAAASSDEQVAQPAPVEQKKNGKK